MDKSSESNAANITITVVSVFILAYALISLPSCGSSSSNITIGNKEVENKKKAEIEKLLNQINETNKRNEENSKLNREQK